MLIAIISTALLLDSNIRNSVCTPAKLPCRRVVEGNNMFIRVNIQINGFIVFNCHKFSFFSFVNCLLTALKQNEQITNRCPRQHIQRHIADRS
jgi:hypothetical protein